MQGIISKKLGMTQLFQEDGSCVAVTILEAESGKVLGVRKDETHGYTAVQVASGDIKESKVSKPVIGQYKKAGIEAHRNINEWRFEGAADLEIGSDYNLSAFEGVEKITVTSKPKGRGFAGTVKRYGFSRGPMTHGSHNHRAPGSLGAHSYPARVFPGKKLGGRMGAQFKTIKNLKVVKMDLEKGLLFVQGAIPGPINGQVIVRKQ